MRHGFAWWAGWVGGLAVVGGIAAAVGYGVVPDHPVIGAVLGLLWGAATSPVMRRLYAVSSLSDTLASG